MISVCRGQVGSLLIVVAPRRTVRAFHAPTARPEELLKSKPMKSFLPIKSMTVLMAS
jgi:hypothetical protein